MELRAAEMRAVEMRAAEMRAAEMSWSWIPLEEWLYESLSKSAILVLEVAFLADMMLMFFDNAVSL